MKRLLLAGAVLFLLGLLTGAVIPVFENTRMALSAHLAGVQNALVLFAFGLLWKHLTLSKANKTWFCCLSIYSMYAIWWSLVLAAAWGTSSATPIAGAGYTGSDWQELVVNLFLYSGSLAIVVASVQAIIGLVRNSTMEP